MIIMRATTYILAVLMLTGLALTSFTLRAEEELTPAAVGSTTGDSLDQNPAQAAPIDPSDGSPSDIPVTQDATADLNTPNAYVPQLNQGDRYVFLEQQIVSGEAANAQAQLETLVAQIEATRNRYHEDLLTPLTLLGDALMQQNLVDEALTHYDRARHIARVSHGLFDERQLPVVYREANAFKRLGDLAAAGQREEYAYEVMAKAYADYDPNILPGLMRLGRFYLQTYNYFAARTLFNRALNIHEANGSDYSVEAIDALSAIALTHKLERFPPFYVSDANDNRLSGPVATSSALEGQRIVFNNFPAGERALQKIVEIRRRQNPQDVAATQDAMLELADWYLMFERANTANTLYRHIYQEMNAAGRDADTLFATPTLLYLPKPHDPQPPNRGARNKTAGLVKLEFNVAPSGRIRQLKTLESQPPKLMDFRVRRSMRQAVFRPKLVEGVAVTAEAQTYVHNFDYFPRFNAIA